ncbi:MAG: flippase [Magnetococcales bacterium]|nr:flippase [Magnetococcales bacterium]
MDEEPLTRRIDSSGMVWSWAAEALRILVNIVVGMLLVRYLSPTDYGIYNYSLSLVLLFLQFSVLGMGMPLCRRAVFSPANILLGTGFVLQGVAALFSEAVLCLFVFLFIEDDTLRIIILIMSLSILTTPFLLIGDYFTAINKMKYNAFAKHASTGATNAAKLLLILLGAPLAAFSGVLVIDLGVWATGLVIAYRRYGSAGSAWQFNGNTARDLLRESWPLWLSSFFFVLSSRLDQILIRHFLDDRAVGLYSAAIMVSEAWYFLPAILATAFLAKLSEMESKQPAAFASHLQELYVALALTGITIALPTSLLAPTVIPLLFGPDYASSAVVLSIHIWAGLFYAVGQATYLWTITKQKQNYYLIFVLLRAVTSLALNMVLIPRHGLQGAAFATLIAQAMGTFLFPLFFPSTRPLVAMSLRAFNPLHHVRLLRQVILLTYSHLRATSPTAPQGGVDNNPSGKHR